MAKLYFSVMRSDLQSDRAAGDDTAALPQHPKGARADLVICHFSNHIDIVVTVPDAPRDAEAEAAAPAVPVDLRPVFARNHWAGASWMFIALAVAGAILANAGLI